LIYYSYVAPCTEPLQNCTKHLRKGFEVGMSSGSKIALYNSLIFVKLAIFSGENLQALLIEVDYCIEVIERLQHKFVLPYLFEYRDTISTLIDKGRSTKPHACPLESASGDEDKEGCKREEGAFMNRALQAFWLGHSTRCDHYAKKATLLQSNHQQNKLVMIFYSAINSFRGVRNKNGTGSSFCKVKDIFRDAIAALKPAAELSAWNFRNKVFLLEAEMLSFEKENDEANSLYQAAISSSRSSRFVHEQGLACELAGLHHKKIGDAHAALELLKRAKECYQSWGSQMKVESINQLMENVII